MLKNIMLTLKLRFTYKTNAFIHSFRTIPVIGQIIPYELYGLSDVKTGLSIVLFIITLIGYPLIFGLLALIMLAFYNSIDNTNAGNFPLIFLIITILINVFRPLTFRADRDSNYAINSLGMDAKRYLLNNFFYKIIIQTIGLFVGLLIVYKISLNGDLITPISFTCVYILPLIYASIRMISANVNITFAKNNIVTFIYFTILVLSGAFLIYFRINESSSFINLLNIYIIIYLILGTLSCVRIITFKKYHYIFKYFYGKKLAKKSLKEIDMERISNTIDTSSKITSNKHGYDLLHDLFVKRHSKILIKPILGYSVVLLIVVIAAICSLFVIPESKDFFHKLFTEYILYFLVLMYFINRGEKITKAMFMNCDHAMLTFRVYRNPKVILEMFKRRLKTSIGFNLIPASIIAIGCLILLVINNESITSIILFPLSLVLLSIFFSVHNLVMYYLLQPYNSGTEERSKSYRIARIITYTVFVYPAYYLDVTLSPTILSFICLGVSLTYIMVSLIIVYKYASKTFKIYY